jgi:hypothetical protein
MSRSLRSTTRASTLRTLWCCPTIDARARMRHATPRAGRASTARPYPSLSRSSRSASRRGSHRVLRAGAPRSGHQPDRRATRRIDQRHCASRLKDKCHQRVSRTGGNLAHSLSLTIIASPQCSIATDQIVRRAVVPEHRLLLALELGNDALRQDFTQLDAPLIE